MINKAFNETEVDELVLCVMNDAKLHHNMIKPYMIMLQKKYNKGIYNPVEAVKGFLRIANEGAKKYAKEFASLEEWNTIFTVADRKETAIRLEQEYRDLYLVSVSEF